MEWLYKVDFAILDWIQEYLQCSFLDTIMPAISFLGNKGWIWILIAIIMLFPKKTRSTGLTMGGGMLTGLLVGNGILKNLVQRERPCWIVEDFELLIDNPTDYSFPSGHALSSFIAATVIYRYNRKWGAAAYVLASLISFSRLYLYVHFPSDILISILLGILIGDLAAWVQQTISQKWRARKDTKRAEEAD